MGTAIKEETFWGPLTKRRRFGTANKRRRFGDHYQRGDVLGTAIKEETFWGPLTNLNKRIGKVANKHEVATNLSQFYKNE